MPIFKASRKIQNFGSSLALTLPSLFVKVNELEKGRVVNIVYNLEGILIVSRSENLEELIKNLNSIIRKLEEKIEG